MARKNNRQSEPDPIPIAGPATPLERHRYETRDERDARLNAEWRKRRERTDRRMDERIAKAVDWARCCIPGCNAELPQPPTPPRGAPPRPSPSPADKLPVCNRHIVIIRKQAMSVWGDPDVLAERERQARRKVRIESERNEFFDKQYENNGADGQLYFVKLNGMVKVGWSSQLRSRLKSYGAGAEILCHFPGTRADETHLHRQLRPFLAKGREWYEDCDLIRDVVAGYIKQHGQPCIFPAWTEPKPPTIRPRRAG